jgi:hypothetical protein
MPAEKRRNTWRARLVSTSMRISHSFHVANKYVQFASIVDS